MVTTDPIYHTYTPVASSFRSARIHQVPLFIFFPPSSASWCLTIDITSTGAFNKVFQTLGPYLRTVVSFDTIYVPI